MRTIAIVNQKGGCGKTTVSINLASALAKMGRKTLLIDMDPQSHCAVGLAVPEEQIEQSVYDVLISKSRNEPVKLTEILWQIADRLELAPASIDLSAFEQQMVSVVQRESCLKNMLDEVKGKYDYAIIDCPPAVSLLTFNALRAATDVIVPVETGYFSLHGLSKELETLSILCERCSRQIDVRVLASMYDVRTKMARDILAELRSHFADKMFKTIINFNTKLKEATSFGQPIGEYDPASKGRKDFHALAEEVVASQAKLQHREIVNSLTGQLEAISYTADELLQAESLSQERRFEGSQTPKSAFGIAEKSPQTEDMQKISERQAQTIKPDIKAIPYYGTEPPGLADIDNRLSNYYGVNQTDDAVVFVTLYPRAESVHIAGDFNNWQPKKTPMEKVDTSGVWQTKLKLPKGEYRYRLVVDGQWQQDPYNEQTELNPFGEFNSIIDVK